MEAKDLKNGGISVLEIIANKKTLEEIRDITKDTYKLSLARCEISGRPLA